MKNLNLKIRPEFDFASIWTCFPFFSNSNETTEPRRLCKQHANCPTPDPGLQCDLFYRRSSQWRPPGAAVPAKAPPIPLLPFSRLSSAPGSTCWLSAAEENKFTADRAEPDPQGKQTHTASLIEMGVCWSLILEKKKNYRRARRVGIHGNAYCQASLLRSSAQHSAEPEWQLCGISKLPLSSVLNVNP